MRKGRRVHRQLVTQFGFVWPTVMITLLIKIVELKKKQVSSSSSRPCKGKTYYNNNRRSNIPLSFFQVSGRVHQPTTPLLPANKKRRTSPGPNKGKLFKKAASSGRPKFGGNQNERTHTHTETKTIFPHHQIRDDHFLQHPKFQKSDGLLLLKIKKEKWNSFSLYQNVFQHKTTLDDYKIKFPDDFGRSDREVEELFESERPKISRPRPDVATSPV